MGLWAAAKRIRHDYRDLRRELAKVPHGPPASITIYESKRERRRHRTP
jgi:hypothetical protein